MEVSLLNLGKGVAIEKFDSELARVIQNVVDPNTDWKGKRRIDLSMVFTANEERDRVFVEIQAKSKLAPEKSSEALVFIGMNTRTGEIQAEEYMSPEQGSLGLGEPSREGKVVALGKK